MSAPLSVLEERSVVPSWGRARGLAYCEYRLLCWAYPRDPDHLSGAAYQNRSKLETLLGPELFQEMRGQTVIDFGCGYGEQTIELARNGAKVAIGLDIREEVLNAARAKASGIPNIQFLTPQQCARGSADIVISLDSFEHFENPAAALALMNDLLRPGGVLLASFGPPWKHPLGGHTFSMFPWAHLLLSESALVGWYNQIKNKSISRFEDVSGGLNRMTITRCEALVRAGNFREALITPVPIRKLRRFHNALTREFTTAVIKCRLTK
ncbi:MAG: class I SAM-dependent methyltransferase [Terriglobales bacterium]